MVKENSDNINTAALFLSSAMTKLITIWYQICFGSAINRCTKLSMSKAA